MKTLKFNNVTEREKERLATVAIIITVLLWSYSFVAVKNLVAIIPPFYIEAIRMLVGGIFISCIFYRRFLKIKPRDILIAFPVGVVLFAGFGLQTFASQYITAGKVAFYAGANVIFVPFFAWALSKKRPTIYAFIAAFVGFIGIAFLTLQDVGGLEGADTLGILAGVSFALHIILIDIALKNMSSIHLAIIQMYVSGGIALILALFTEKMPPISSIPSEAIYSLLYLGFLCTGVAYLLQNISQKFVNSSKVSLMLVFESFLGALMGVLILKEPVTINLLLGGGFIFIAVIVCESGESFMTKYILKNKKI